MFICQKHIHQQTVAPPRLSSNNHPAPFPRDLCTPCGRIQGTACGPCSRARSAFRPGSRLCPKLGHEDEVRLVYFALLSIYNISDGDRFQQTMLINGQLFIGVTYVTGVALLWFKDIYIYIQFYYKYSILIKNTAFQGRFEK